MSSKKIQLLLIGGICAVTLHFSIRLFIGAWHYSTLQNKSIAKILQWETVPVKDRFALKARYSFEAQNQTWQGEYTLSPPYYLNELSAIEALKEKRTMSAWYRPKNPQISALERNFPLSYLFRSIICYGVLIYFFYFYKRLVRV